MSAGNRAVIRMYFNTQVRFGAGVDALSHCTESLCCVSENPPAKAVAVDDAARVWANIRTAVHEPGNLAARSELLRGTIEPKRFENFLN